MHKHYDTLVVGPISLDQNIDYQDFERREVVASALDAYDDADQHRTQHAQNRFKITDFFQYDTCLASIHIRQLPFCKNRRESQYAIAFIARVILHIVP